MRVSFMERDTLSYFFLVKSLSWGFKITIRILMKSIAEILVKLVLRE